MWCTASWSKVKLIELAWLLIEWQNTDWRFVRSTHLAVTFKGSTSLSYFCLLSSARIRTQDGWMGSSNAYSLLGHCQLLLLSRQQIKKDGAIGHNCNIPQLMATCREKFQKMQRIKSLPFANVKVILYILRVLGRGSLGLHWPLKMSDYCWASKVKFSKLIKATMN